MASSAGSSSPPTAGPTALPFCDATQMPTTMYMDGFHSTLRAYLSSSFGDGGAAAPQMDDHDHTANAALPCLNLVLPGWTLDTPAKFLGAAIATIVLGMAAEGLAAARSGGWVRRRSRRLAHAICSRSSDGSRSSGTRPTTAAAAKWHQYLQKMGLVGAHVLQAWMGYVLMLAAMSYSLELLGSALVGLGIGYATFFDLDPYEDDDDDDGHGHGYDEVGGEEEEEGAAEGNAGMTAALPEGSGGNNGNGIHTGRRDAGAPSSCCDVAGRGPPPRRAFPFLQSPVPTTLTGVGNGRRRTTSDTRGMGDANDNNDNDADIADARTLQGGNHNCDGAADNLRLHEDDKMTPLL